MTDKQDKAGNEIDLLSLLSAIWKGIRDFIKGLLDVILFLFVFGIKRIVWIVIIIVLGTGTGYLLHRISDKTYTSDMIAQPNGFTSIDMVEYINDIHEMCEKGNYLGIAGAFNIHEDDAEKIANIEAFTYIDVNGDKIGDHIDYDHAYDAKDTTTAIILDRLLIQAEVVDNSKFVSVRNGLIYYINNNPYLQIVNAHKKEELKALIAQSTKEIEKLDSLQYIEYYRSFEDMDLTKDGQIVFMTEKETQLYYRDKMSLLNTKLAYEKAEKLSTEPITIIKDFSELLEEDNPLTYYIIKSNIYFLLAGYLVLLSIFYWRRIITYLESKG